MKPRRSWTKVGIFSTLVLLAVFGWWFAAQARRGQEVIDRSEAGRAEVAANVQGGDAEEKVKALIARQRWDSAYDPVMRGYDLQFPLGSTVGEEHFLNVHIAIGGGRVTGISLRDFHRTL